MNLLAVQWLGLHTFTAKGIGSVPGQGIKIPQASYCGHMCVCIYRYICILHVNIYTTYNLDTENIFFKKSENEQET